jgi:PAS domain S-box-containing protein
VLQNAPVMYAAGHGTSDESEASTDSDRYRLIFESAIVGMFLSTVEGRCVTVNPALARIFGYASPEEMLDTLTDTRSEVYVDPSRRDEMIERLRRDGAVDRFDFEGRRKDGTVVSLCQSAIAIRDAEGRVTHIQGLVEDVTARKRAEEDLLAARRHLDYVLSMSPAVIYVFRLRPRGAPAVEWTSENVEQLTGFTAAESLAPGWWSEHVHTHDRVPAEEKLAALAGAGRLVHEYRFQRRDGSYLWIRDEGRLVSTDHDTGAAIVGAWTDVTQRKHEQEERERQRDALVQSQKLADMGTLLAGVAHELNNPLSIVLGHAELLVRDGGPETTTRRARSVAQAAERCTRIVRNFLSLARHHSTERERLSINDIVHDAVELLGYSLRVDDVELSLDLSPDLPAVWGDSHQLHQVLVNFLTNAHHAARQQPRRRRIRITTRRSDGGARVTVEDSGPGIPDAIRGRVFEPFFTTKPAGIGTGLGLSLCQGIVEGHDGRIDVGSSAELGGACLVVTLPTGSPAPAARVAAASAAVVAPAAYKVLVVDDERPLADVVAEGLREVGYGVEVASDGVEALEKLRVEKFDVVLSDMRMPTLDGICLYRACQSLGDFRPPAFVFMTGDGLTPQTMEFLTQPGRVHLEKPFSAEQLRALLSEVVSRPAGGRETC